MSVRRAALGLALTACLGACSARTAETVGETAETVLTLQSGTISELRDRRGTGPFTVYDVSPDDMLDVLEKARGAGGKAVQAVFVYANAREVIAKERAADEADDTAYEGAFRTAMLAAVLPQPGEPGRCRVEIHALDRGPFHKGVVRWTRDMPTWIAEVLAEREAPIAPLTR